MLTLTHCLINDRVWIQDPFFFLFLSSSSFFLWLGSGCLIDAEEGCTPMGRRGDDAAAHRPPARLQPPLYATYVTSEKGMPFGFMNKKPRGVKFTGQQGKKFSADGTRLALFNDREHVERSWRTELARAAQSEQAHGDRRGEALHWGGKQRKRREEGRVRERERDRERDREREAEIEILSHSPSWGLRRIAFGVSQLVRGGTSPFLRSVKVGCVWRKKSGVDDLFCF